MTTAGPSFAASKASKKRTGVRDQRLQWSLGSSERSSPLTAEMKGSVAPLPTGSGPGKGALEGNPKQL